MNHKKETTRKEFLSSSAGLAAGAAFLGSMGFNRMAHADGDVITQIARFGLQEGKEEAAKEVLTAMIAGVEKTEPGVLAYIGHFTDTDPKEVVFFEVYKDAAALKAHGTTPHMNEMRAKFMQVFKPPLKLEKLTKVAGVTR